MQAVEEMRKLMAGFSKELPTLLTMEEAARELSVSGRTLQRMVRSGEILASPTRGRLKIASSEIRRIATNTIVVKPRGRKLKAVPTTGGYSAENERKKLMELRKKRR